jgi:hypothetical protein
MQLSIHDIGTKRASTALELAGEDGSPVRLENFSIFRFGEVIVRSSWSPEHITKRVATSELENARSWVFWLYREWEELRLFLGRSPLRFVLVSGISKYGLPLLVSEQEGQYVWQTNIKSTQRAAPDKFPLSPFVGNTNVLAVEGAWMI